MPAAIEKGSLLMQLVKLDSRVIGGRIVVFRGFR